MSTTLRGSWTSPTAENNTTAPPLATSTPATSTPASPLPPASSGSPLSPSATSPLHRSIISGIAFAGTEVRAGVVAVIRWLVSCCKRRLPSILISCRQRKFTFHEVQGFTNGFSRENLLGEGGFAHVYRGVCSNGEAVAVKRLKEKLTGQRELGFWAEVKTLGRIRHKNVVSLVGYCTEGSELILVYELVPNRSLDCHLHGEGRRTLDWTTRMKIAVGSAKGLKYLHEDCHPTIIHCDIKAANILVNFDFEAKIADFGCAKFASDSNHSDTGPLSTFPYVDPENTSSGELNPNLDTFSFGVVLLELITGCKPEVLGVEPQLKRALGDGNFDALVDPRLQNNYNQSQMTRMVACADACIRRSALCRPKMSLIAGVLEGHRPISDLDVGNADINDGIRAGSSDLDSEHGNNYYRESTGEYGSRSAGPSLRTAQDLEMGRTVALTERDIKSERRSTPKRGWQDRPGTCQNLL